MARTSFSGPVASDNGFINLSDNDKGITIKAPASLTADYVLTLPPNDGNNGQFLSTDGSGVLSWTPGDGSGTVTSVGGTGTISGISLSGTVTTAGDLTLGGALDLSSPPAIGGTAAAAGAFTDLTVNDKLIGAIQPLTGAGAVNLTDPITTITSTAADALTLADGVAGQLKYLVMIVDGGDATLTPDTMIGGTTITFDAVGDACTLVYTSAGWAVVGISGAVVA